MSQLLPYFNSYFCKDEQGWALIVKNKKSNCVELFNLSIQFNSIQVLWANNNDTISLFKYITEFWGFFFQL